MRKLKAIARAMIEVALTTGIAQHKLERGLILTLRYYDGKRALSLTRHGVQPGEKEEQICREAFSVPDDAERKTEIQRGYYVVRFIWAEVRQLEWQKYIDSI